MRRLLLVLALTSVAVVGCKKKKDPETVVTEEETSSDGPTFVKIDMDTEEEETDDMLGSELMQATAHCGELVKLEPSAMMGRLSDGEIRCLDKLLRDSERQTVKDKVSRVLMADSWAKGDQHRWEAIVRRHLETIDRSDPDLCYSFAKYLSKRGPEFSDETMKWADVALENRSYWEGDTHVSRVYSLYRLKAYASARKWNWLEEEYLKEPGEQLADEKKMARNSAKTLAREWLEYARQSGKDTTVAMQMCISAAGTAEFCDQGVTATADDG